MALERQPVDYAEFGKRAHLVSIGAAVVALGLAFMGRAFGDVKLNMLRFVGYFIGTGVFVACASAALAFASESIAGKRRWYTFAVPIVVVVVAFYALVKFFGLPWTIT